MTPRINQLQKLSQTLPGANQQVATGLQEAQKTQMQAAIKGMQPAQATTANAQQLGAQQYQAQAAPMLEAQKQTQTQQTGIGQLQLQEQGRANRQQLGDQTIRLGQDQLRMADKLNSINKELKNKLIDDQLKFKLDSKGQETLNTRQLMDWAVTKSQSAEEAKDYAASAEKAMRRELQILKTYEDKINQALSQGYVKENKMLDQQTKLNLTKRRQEIIAAQQRAQIRKQNSQAMTTGLVSLVVGAGVAAIPGGAPFAPAAMAATSGIMQASQ